MSNHAVLTATRLFEFLHRRTPWHRRLWGIGTCLSLKEVVEYSTTRREAGLPPEGLKYVAEASRREVANDPGAAPFAARLDTILARGERLDANAEYQLEHLAERVDEGYLGRWATAIESGTQPPVEQTARSIATRPLDKGFSSDHLYRWLDADRHHNEKPHLTRILTEASEMCETTRENARGHSPLFHSRIADTAPTGRPMDERGRNSRSARGTTTRSGQAAPGRRLRVDRQRTGPLGSCRGGKRLGRPSECPSPSRASRRRDGAHRRCRLRGGQPP